MFNTKKLGAFFAGIVMATTLMAPTAVFAKDISKSITANNVMYSVTGTRYTFYTSEAAAKAGNENGIAKTTDGKEAVVEVGPYLIGSAAASTNTIELTAGDYWVVETTPGKNLTDDAAYSNKTPKKVTVKAGTTYSNPQVEKSTDTPWIVIPPKIQKNGDVNGQGVLSGAIFKVEYFACEETSQADSTNLKKTWFFSTDNTGKIDIQSFTPVSFEGKQSDSFYQVNGKRVFLVGVYRITEVKAPEGHMIGKNATITFPETQMGSIQYADPDTATINDTSVKTFKNDPIRGGVYLVKTDMDALHGLSADEAAALATGQGEGSLVGAEFAIYNYSGKDMKVDGKTYPTYKANSNMNKPIMTITTVLDEETGHAIAKTPRADSLPYGKYCVVETKAPKGYGLNPTVLEVPDFDENVAAKYYYVGKTAPEWVHLL